MKSKGFNVFHTKLKSPIPVYGRTGLVTSILSHLIGPICCFKVMENTFIWGRLFQWLKMANKSAFFIVSKNSRYFPDLAFSLLIIHARNVE